MDEACACGICGEGFTTHRRLGIHLVDMHGRELPYGKDTPYWAVVYTDGGRFSACACGYRTKEVPIGDLDKLGSMLDEMALHSIEKNFYCLRKRACTEALSSL